MALQLLHAHTDMHAQHEMEFKKSQGNIIGVRNGAGGITWVKSMGVEKRKTSPSHIYLAGQYAYLGFYCYLEEKNVDNQRLVGR